MKRATQDLEDNARRTREMWHEIDNALKDFEQRATKNPKACAEEAMRKVAYELNLYRVTCKRLFGLDLELKQEWWGRTPLPHDPNSRALFIDCVLLYEMFVGVWQAYSDGIQRPDLHGDNLARAMCEIYVQAKLAEPYLLTCSTEIVVEQLPNQTREEVLAEQLTGYFSAVLSTSPTYRLGRALREAGPPDSVLLKELPAEAILAWRERGNENFLLKNLRGRIADSIAKRASEASHRPGTVDSADAIEQSSAGEMDLDLEDFERRETLNQQLAELQRWTEQANLSEQQKEVHELDMSTNYDTETIARELGITPGHVRKVRHDYVQKVRKAAGL